MNSQIFSDNQNKLYTLKEIQEILNVSYSHLVNNIIKSEDPKKKLETVNVGKGSRPEYRVTQQALNDYLAKRSGQRTIKDVVSELQSIRNSIIVSYITTAENGIHPDDSLFVSDVLDDIINRKKIQGKIPKLDLFINSFGGSIDAAYKIVRLLWRYADEVNSIVPIYAKSAATTICLGTREIVMTPVSELGPVDPILENPKTKEKIPAKSIKIFLSYASDKDRLIADKIDPNKIDKLGEKLDPVLAGAYINTINTSKEYIRILLQNYMFKGKNIEKEIDNFVDYFTETHSSHAFVIDYDEAIKQNLSVKMANKNELSLIKQLMGFYTQFMQMQGVNKLVGNEFWQIYQHLRKN